MGKTEDLYRKVRSHLDDLGYHQPVSVHSLFLVKKLLDDLETLTSKLHHYKTLAEESLQTVSELQLGIEPYRQSNIQLVQENNKLHSQLLQEREKAEDNERALKKQIRAFENEKQHQQFLCTQHFARIGDLQQELVEKTAALSQVKGTAKSTKNSVTNSKRVSKLSGTDSAAGKSTDSDRLLKETAVLQHTLDHLTDKVNRLNEEKMEFNDIITAYKNKLEARDKEILRLTQLLEGGRPISAVNKDCCCCPSQATDYRLLAKTQMLEDQLEECQELRHEAMRRAVNLAKRNQRLEKDMHGREDETKNCCCAENSKKLCKLQEKLDCRQLQIDQLENCIESLKVKNEGFLKDKTDINTKLEQAEEENKKLNERISQMTTIEHDLMLEIERMKRSNALQKAQLAEMEVKLAKEQSEPPKVAQPVARFRHVGKKEKQDSTKTVLTKTAVPSTKGPTKSFVSKNPPKNKTAFRTKTQNTQQPENTHSSQSPSSPSREVTRSPSPVQKEQLLKDRMQFKRQIDEMNRKHTEHSARLHLPSNPEFQGANSGEPQWLLLERVQAERDYYHKEFTRIQNQLNSIPDHSSEPTNVLSPNHKLEKLITERDYYQDEVNRLKEELAKATVDKSEIDELQKKLITKEDELMEIFDKLRELERRQDNTQDIQNLRKQLSERHEEILVKDKKIEDLERNQLSSNFLETNAELWRKLNLKEEEVLMMKEKVRELEHQGSNIKHIEELQRRLNAKEDELSIVKKKLELSEQSFRDVEYKSYLQVREFSSKLDDKNKETTKLYRRIQELEMVQPSVSCNHQGIMTRLEIERDNARGDVVRLQDERNALRGKLQMLTEEHIMEYTKLESINTDLNSRLIRLEMERNDVINRESNLQSEVKIYKEQFQEYKDKVRNLNSELSHQRSSYNHIKLLQEQTDRALNASQDILTQTESELTNALHRLQELEQMNSSLHREIADMKNERSILKSNLAQIDQEKDALLLKMDEKTELNVGLEREIQSREHRIAHLEDIVADLKKKLDLALDGNAHSEQNMRQALQEASRLRQQVDKLEQNRDNILRENRRLQNDLAAITSDCQIANRNLESSRREVEDLKLQLQGYVAEVRRVEEILQQKEAERTDMLEQFRSLTLEATVLESNNHSLESEAKSTKSCLRETQEKVQVLEEKLIEKDSLLHGYETQIGELTHHIAKLERQVSSLSDEKKEVKRNVTAARDLSSSLESQRQSLAQQLAQVVADNKRLEAEVQNLQGEVCELRDMLGQERKNSATLENVLAASRQETLQRNMDNSDLKAQVQCLQSKLCDLQDKLKHGSLALRHCQDEASDYQNQVAELRREITNERFERARVEEEKRPKVTKSCLCKSVIKSKQQKSCVCCILNQYAQLYVKESHAKHDTPLSTQEMFKNVSFKLTSTTISEETSTATYVELKCPNTECKFETDLTKDEILLDSIIKDKMMNLNFIQDQMDKIQSRLINLEQKYGNSSTYKELFIKENTSVNLEQTVSDAYEKDLIANYKTEIIESSSKPVSCRKLENKMSHQLHNIVYESDLSFHSCKSQLNLKQINTIHDIDSKSGKHSDKQEHFMKNIDSTLKDTSLSDKSIECDSIDHTESLQFKKRKVIELCNRLLESTENLQSEMLSNVDYTKAREKNLSKSFKTVVETIKNIEFELLNDNYCSKSVTSFDKNQDATSLKMHTTLSYNMEEKNANDSENTSKHILLQKSTENNMSDSSLMSSLFSECFENFSEVTKENKPYETLFLLPNSTKNQNGETNSVDNTPQSKIIQHHNEFVLKENLVILNEEHGENLDINYETNNNKSLPFDKASNVKKADIAMTKRTEICALDPVPLGIMLSNNSYAVKLAVMILLAAFGMNRSHSACKE